MGIRDHQLDALEAAFDQPFQERRPERLGFGGTKAQANDLAPAIGRHRHGDYCRDRDDAPAVAHLEVSGVEPQIPPFALNWSLQEGVDPLVDVLAQLGDLALRDAGEAHRLHQLINPPGRHAADPGLLDHRDQRLLGGLARLEERREVRPLAQLGDAQLERAQACVEAALAIAVAVVQPLGADQPFDIGSIRICSTASATERRKSPSPLFCSRSTSAILSSVIGSSVSSG